MQNRAETFMTADPMVNKVVLLSIRFPDNIEVIPAKLINQPHPNRCRFVDRQLQSHSLCQQIRGAESVKYRKIIGNIPGHQWRRAYCQMLFGTEPCLD